MNYFFESLPEKLRKLNLFGTKIFYEIMNVSTILSACKKLEHFLKAVNNLLEDFNSIQCSYIIYIILFTILY